MQRVNVDAGLTGSQRGDSKEAANESRPTKRNNAHKVRSKPLERRMVVNVAWRGTRHGGQMNAGAAEGVAQQTAGLATGDGYTDPRRHRWVNRGTSGKGSG